MDLRLNLAIAIAPALALLWLFKKWDEKRPEPPGAVRKVVLFGMVTCLPAAGIELGLSGVLGRTVLEAQGGFVNAFLVAALTEEALKLSVVLLYLWRKPHFDEVMDGILYTAAASLGFALLENVLYSATNPMTGLVRAFTAVPLHAICSGIMGYFVGRAKLAKAARARWILGGFAAAVAIHGLYDWIVFSGAGFGALPGDPLVALVVVVCLVGACGVVLRMLVLHALSLDDRLLGPSPRPLPTPMPFAVPAGFVASSYPPYPVARPRFDAQASSAQQAPAETFLPNPLAYAPRAPQAVYAAPASNGATPAAAVVTDREGSER